MIRKKTVLVLGAGASMEYGYPSGAELRRQILTELQGSNSLLERTMRASQCESHLISEFCDALHKSGGQSVDQLLEHRPSLIPVGKVAIAGILLKYEKLERLWEDGWYQHLFAQMNSRFDDFGANALSIVTFNYDRSLDEFLYQSVLNKYGKSPKETADAIRNIPIIHFYGSLGPLLWQSEHGRAYWPTPLPDDILSISNSIKIIHEGATLADIGDQSREIARQKLAEAERIVFVGFGYHETNMSRLLTVALTARRVTGSFVGMFPKERRKVRGIFASLTKRGTSDGIVLGGYESDAKDTLEFLRKEIVFE